MSGMNRTPAVEAVCAYQPGFIKVYTDLEDEPHFRRLICAHLDDSTNPANKDIVLCSTCDSMLQAGAVIINSDGKPIGKTSVVFQLEVYGAIKELISFNPPNKGWMIERTTSRNRRKGTRLFVHSFDLFDLDRGPEPVVTKNPTEALMVDEETALKLSVLVRLLKYDCTVTQTGLRKPTGKRPASPRLAKAGR